MTQNHVVLGGYLGGSVEVRVLPTGGKVANMRLGQSYNYTDSKNNDQRRTNWFSVVAYGSVAEIASQFGKGDNIVLDGHLESREWEAQDGVKRRVIEVVARNVARIDKTPAKTNSGAGGTPERRDDDPDWPTE